MSLIAALGVSAQMSKLLREDSDKKKLKYQLEIKSSLSKYKGNDNYIFSAKN